MTCCCAFGSAVDAQFTQKKAVQELGRYRSRGPGVTTRFLRDGLAGAGVSAGTLLDIGAGIGALTFELLDQGVASAIAIDASAAYVTAASDEAARRGRSGSVRFLHGDFVSLSTQLRAADTVTLDRVICCYPDYGPLLDRALQLATHHFACSYPRDRWFVRWAVRIENGLRRLRANPFRTVVHPVAEMHRMINDAEFQLVSRSQTATWSADVYIRTSTRARSEA